MSSDLLVRKNYKWLGLILVLSAFALISKYCTPTSNYSYYRRAVFYKADDSTSGLESTPLMNWTDVNGRFFKEITIYSLY